jgi:hypothetical protein
MTLVPAYGRDYTNAADVKAAWDADKDFRIQDVSSPYDGSYINKPQAKAGDTFKIRYSKLTKFVIIKA